MRMGMHYGSRTADRLTDRQRDVLALIAHGCTNGQIAERLGITLDGAKWHVSEIMAKLGVSSREEAVAAWRAEHSLGARLSRATRWAGATLFTSQAAGIVAGVAVAVIVAAAVVALIVANNGGDDSNSAAIASPTPGTTTTPAASASATTTTTASATSTTAATPSPSVSVPGPLLAPTSLTKLQMVDSSNGWALDSNRWLLRTADGARTWHNVSPNQGPHRNVNQAFFLDINHAWALATDTTPGSSDAKAVVLRTTDGGATWQASDPFTSPVPQGTLSFADASNGWYFESQGAGAGSQGITIYRTTDGGATWAKMGETAGAIGSSSPTLPLTCIKSEPLLLTATTGFATGSCAGGPPFLYRTKDAGRVWAIIPLPDPADPSKALASCSCGMATPVFPTKNDGLVVMSGEHQAIYVTHDAGATWKPTGPLPGKVPSTIAFADASHGWLLDYPHLYTTTDAGSSWADLGKPPFDNALLSFISPSDGFAWVRESAQGNTNTAGLVHTTDTGKTWTPVK